MATVWMIQQRDQGQWTTEGVGDPKANAFATRAEAEDAVAELRELGDDWAEGEYRVVEREAPRAARISLDNGVSYVAVGDLADGVVAEIVGGRRAVAWDEEIREAVHGTTDDPREWLETYCARHAARHGTLVLP